MSNIINEGIKEDILNQIQDDHGFAKEFYEDNLREVISKSGMTEIEKWDLYQLETWLVEDTFERMGYS
jgi:hypothetical protein